jgi:hypothetical protein
MTADSVTGGSKRTYGRIPIEEEEAVEIVSALVDRRQLCSKELQGTEGEARKVLRTRIKAIQKSITEVQRTRAELGWMDSEDPWFFTRIGERWLAEHANTEIGQSYGRIRFDAEQAAEIVSALIARWQLRVQELEGTQGEVRKVVKTQISVLKKSIYRVQTTRAKLGWMDSEDPWFFSSVGEKWLAEQAKTEVGSQPDDDAA